MEYKPKQRIEPQIMLDERKHKPYVSFKKHQIPENKLKEMDPFNKVFGMLKEDHSNIQWKPIDTIDTALKEEE